MNKQTSHKFKVALLILAIGTVAGCSLDNISATGGGASSQEDLLAAAHVLGGSLSGDDSGLILSVRDALTLVSESSFMADQLGAEQDRSGRGNQSNYNHIYRKNTGIHIVSFKRQVNRALFNKTVYDSLRYRYHTANGANIRYPRQSERITTIYYDGKHVGKITTLHEKFHFVRQDTFLITGLKNSYLDVNGVVHGAGSIKIISQKGASFNRAYELEINLLNFKVSAQIFNKKGDFWQNVSGTLTWQLTLYDNGNATKMGGTIKMAGAGIAMLNFSGSTKEYQVNLNNGDIKDQDEEFEGRITGVNSTEKSITLFNGRRLYLTSKTKIDGEDYKSLKAVQSAVNKGINVWAEGEGGIQNRRFVVKEIEFEQEDKDNEENEIEFEEIVTSVDGSANIFTLSGGVTVAIEKATVIDKEGDFQSLQEVAAALNNGLQVAAEGEAINNSKTAISGLIATNVKFEKVEEDNDN